MNRTTRRPRLLSLEGRVTPSVFTVLNTFDAGPGSLRQAVIDANAFPGTDTVAFDPAAFASAQTIVLKTGQLAVTSPMTVAGPVAGVTIDGNKASRIFNVDVPGAKGQPFSFSGLTLTGGVVSSGGGGAILIVDEAVTLKNIIISGCSAAGKGGAVSCESSNGSLRVEDCVLVNNSSSSAGGALSAGSFSSLIIARCLLSGNIAKAGGGGGAYASGSLTATDSTFSGNSAPGYTGGAMSGFSCDTKIRNCTISGNSARFGGGIGVFQGKLLVQNCTVVFNSATQQYGGLYHANAPLTVESSVVAKNTAPSNADLNGNVTANFSLVGTTLGATITGSNNKLNADPLLAPLAPNGGPHPTHLPQSGSPCIDAGANPAGLVFDQRGSGFPRAQNGIADIGAVETVGKRPWAVAVCPDVKSAGPAAQVVTVTYGDNVAVNVATLATGNVTVAGPGGFTATPTFVSVDVNTDGTPRVATYSFEPPGGAWDPADNGTYTVSMAGGQVYDTEVPTPSDVPAGPLVTFGVAVPTTYVVTNPGDANAGSGLAGDLRYCVTQANANAGAGPHVIDLTALVGEITLIQGQLPVTAPLGLAFVGPDASKLTISVEGGATPTNRVFNVTSPGATSVRGLTLANGFLSSGNGGAILASAGWLTVEDVTFTNNRARVVSPGLGGGGAIYFTGAGLDVTRCKFQRNQSYWGAGVEANGVQGPVRVTDCVFDGNDGDALYFSESVEVQVSRTSVLRSSDAGMRMYSAISVAVVDSTFDGNGWGGINASTSAGGMLLISGSTFTRNTLYTGGGVNAGMPATIRNSTFIDNVANGGGTNGGGAIWSSWSLNVFNCTIVRNTAYGAGAGGIQSYAGSPFTLQSTIISGNVGNGHYDISCNYPLAIGGTNNLIGVGNVGNFTLSGPNQAGTAAAPLNPRLAWLADNGGPTQTIALLPGSPAIDAGNNAAGLAFDQRGPGFPRVVGGAADVGAFEFQPSDPAAVMAVIPDVVTAGPTPNTVVVTYTSPAGVDASTFDTNDVSMTGPGGAVLAVTSAVASVPGNGSPRIVTYSFTPPGGSWDSPDAGDYTVTLNGNEVATTGGTFSPAQVLGIIRVVLPTTFVVNAVNDETVDSDGKTSLREALALANADTTTLDTITFDPAAFAGPQTIQLALGDLDVSSGLVVNGPGADRLTIDGKGKSSVWNINASSRVNVTLTGMKITNGKYFYGGGILLGDQNLTLDSVWITGNIGTYNGAAISAYRSRVVVLNSTISGNTAGGPGAGIYLIGSPQTYLLVRNSTLSNNSNTGAGYSGGAVFFSPYQTGSVAKIQNSTVTGNKAAGDGGGISAGLANLTIESSIVAGNTAGTGVGADIAGKTVTAVNSLIGVGDSGFTLVAQGTTVAGTKSSPLDPLLGPLQNNGGPTPTHALLPGSPAIDKGSNPAGLASDQRGPGFVRVVGAAADMGAVETQPAAPPPTVTSVVVNNGAAQRSMVTKLTVTFSEPVTFPGGLAAAFELRRTGPGGPTGPVNLAAVQAGNTVTLTFLGGGAVGIDPGSSLIDGVYRFTVVASKVLGPGGALDGDGNGTPGGDFVTPDAGPGRLHRLVGDADGDGDTDATDFAAFRTAFGNPTPATAFDLDADGDVDAQDFAAFRGRFGSAV